VTAETSAWNRRRVGAYAVCVERREILLTRLWEADIEAGRWTLPGGGMDFGEHPDQTVLRELYEETGLAGTIRRLLDVQSHVYPAWREHGPLQMVQFIYDVEASGIPRVIEQGGSTVEAAWIPLEDVGRLGRVPLVDQALDLLR
jgi:8-oxo-dGTP diphosphatase